MTHNLIRRFLGAGFASMAVCLVALTFALPQTASAVVDPMAITGTITNSVGGAKVDNADVVLLDMDGEWIDEFATGSDGVYEFYYLDAGTYWLEVSAPNCETQYVSVSYDGTNKTVKDIMLIGLALAFKGTVTDSVSGDPLVAAGVWVSDPANPESGFYTDTAADGTYEIYAPAGTYDVYADAVSYSASSTVGVVFDGSTAITKDFALVKNPLAFQGTVTDSVTNLPVEDATIVVYDAAGDFVEEAYSAIDGTYALYAPAGTFDIEVMAESYHDVYVMNVTFDGTTAVTKNFALVPPAVTRVGGKNRYETAEQIARKGWDSAGDKSWTDVTDIVIANGEAGKEADPVTAAGLAGAYDAPLLLTQASVLPPSTRRVIAEIALKNPGVKIHLIGGTTVLPDSRWNNIKAIKGVSPLKHRVAGDDRYKTSVEIAKAIIAVVGADNLNGFILIAGDNPAAFYDGLAASPISYVNQMPMLSVKKGSMPDVVSKFLARADLRDYERFAASGSTYIGSVPAKGAIRMATSTNRYTASTQIAEFAIEWGMTGEQDVALASSLPDALTGGAFLGRRYGVLLFTDSSKSIQSSPKSFIDDYSSSIIDGWVIGGTSVLPTSQETTFRNLIK